jgi:hypothetical protein
MTGSLWGCTEYLNKQPDMGIDENVVYKDYTSITNYLDRCFLELEAYWNINDYMASNSIQLNPRSHNSQMSDECATTDNNPVSLPVNNGNWLLRSGNGSWEIGVTDNTAISRTYRALRVANRVIANYGRVPMSEDETRKVAGQAHFFRAWYYFQLMKRYGGMPIFDRVFLGGDDDIPRQTYAVSHDWMMTDLETAADMLPDEWDDANTGRPTKAAALALKAMTELYAASPLMQNDLESTVVKPYNQERAAQAAKYAEEAIDHVDAHSYFRLVSNGEYKNIFYWATPPFSHPEHIWYNRRYLNQPTNNYMEHFRIYCQSLVTSTAAGSFAASLPMPTLNAANWYEKKGSDGKYYPIDDPRSGYSLGSEPFADRDPRFYNNILTPGDKFGNMPDRAGAPSGLNVGTVDYRQSFYPQGREYRLHTTNATSNSRQISGFAHIKFHWPESNDFVGARQTTLYRFGTTVYIRAAQLYLDFAEASFEATGSATAVVPGCTMNALQALNTVRLRGGITELPADIAADPDKFREAYRRERAVELFMENHRWWDIRRWMIAHELFKGTAPIKGLRATLTNDIIAEMNALKPSLNATALNRLFGSDGNTPNIELYIEWFYETGKMPARFAYEQFDMTVETRVFEMRNYWYPFPLADVAAMTNLKQNPGW